MKNLRSSDDLDSYSDKNVDGEPLNSDRPSSSSRGGFFRKSFSVNNFSRNRDRDDAGFSTDLSRRRFNRDFDGGFDNRRKETDFRFREERLNRSESACFSRREFPKGFRSERERPKREGGFSSWRRFGGEDRERRGLSLRVREERETSVKSPNQLSKLRVDSRSSRSRSKSLASPTWSKDSGSEQSKSAGNAVKRSEEEVQGKSSRSSSEMEEGELEPEPQSETESRLAPTINDSKEPTCAVDACKDAKIDCSFREMKKTVVFDDNLTKAETESNREFSHVGGEMQMDETVTDKNSVENGENVPELAIEGMNASTSLASEHELKDDRDTADVNEITDMVDDKGDKEEEYKENHELKLEQSLSPAVPEWSQAEKLKQVKRSDGDANKLEVQTLKCVKENPLGDRAPAEYISIVSDSSVHKFEDKGKQIDVPLTNLLGNALFSEGKSEDRTDREKDEDDNFGGPSLRGFELFSSSPVRKKYKTEHAGVNKPKEEKLLLEPLDLSLSLPDVLLPIGGQDTNQALGSPVRSGSVRSLTDTFCTNSDGVTMSMSFSGSLSFNHNPSCSLNHTIGDNEQSVHSRPIFQGIDWQALSQNDSRYNENTVYQKLMENGNGSVQPQAMKGILISGQAEQAHLRLTDGSSKAANRLDKQLSFPAYPRTVSVEIVEKKKKAKDIFGSSISWISGLESGEDDFVEKVIKYILSDSMHVMTKRFHEMSTQYIISLKENIRLMMLKNVHLGAFQSALQKRSDITLESLTKSHRAHLEILVALKTGRSDFLQLDNSISSSHLAEIYMNMRCRNLSCRVLVPVDECDCRVCSRKDGFCSACMCLVCSNFDMASNTCSWVGCDVCLHWCHTDCAIQRSCIRNGINASEMQFHCAACNHPSEMFGFVKEVFLNFAREWNFERFCKELEYVSKIFSPSKDSRGKQLRQGVDKMLISLKSKSIDMPGACNWILGFISDCDSSTPGETRAPSRHEQPKPRHEKGSASQDTAWLRSVSSADKPHRQLKRSASTVDAFHRERVETDLKRGITQEPGFEELESIVRMKQAEAEMFQGRADEARKEAEGLKQIAVGKKEKVEEEYKRMMGKMGMEEAKEKRRKVYEALEVMERGQREFYEMKMRMEEEMRGLLSKIEVTKQSLAL